MEALWTPVFAFAALAVFLGFGDFIANKTKGLISALVVASLIYLVGFWTGLIPLDAIEKTNLPSIMSVFGIALMITNLGTMIDLKMILNEWKTIVVAFVGLLGICVGAFTVGQLVFGKVYALSSVPPIAGGIIATSIISEAATTAGRAEIAGYVALLTGVDMFIVMPTSSFILRKEVTGLLKSGNIPGINVTDKQTKKFNLKFIPDFPASLQSETIIIAKLAITIVIANFISKLTVLPSGTPILNANIAYLLLGILFTEIGFLDKQSLTKSNSMGILMIGTMAIVMVGLKGIDIKAFLDMIGPIIGMLIISAIFVCVFAALMGKVLGYSPAISMAIGLTSMVGYPGTQIITEEVIRNLDCSDEDKEKLQAYVLPKLLVGGFTTVTIASVVFAGVLAPMIFG